MLHILLDQLIGSSVLASHHSKYLVLPWRRSALSGCSQLLLQFSGEASFHRLDSDKNCVHFIKISGGWQLQYSLICHWVIGPDFIKMKILSVYLLFSHLYMHWRTRTQYEMYWVRLLIYPASAPKLTVLTFLLPPPVR